MLKKKLLLMSLTALTTLTGLNINLTQKENIINTNPVHYAQRRMNKAVTGKIMDPYNCGDSLDTPFYDANGNTYGENANTLYFFIYEFPHVF